MGELKIIGERGLCRPNSHLVISEIDEEREVFFEIKNDLDIYSSKIINRDQAQQIVNHLKTQFEL